MPGAALTLIALIIQLTVNPNGGHGYFRNEFYCIACTNHLDWSYVDHPPFSIFILWRNRIFLGDSLFAIRSQPAIVNTAGCEARFLIQKRYFQMHK